MNKFSWPDNPVFRREMLTRWRHPAAFVLVVAYALVIAVAVGWQIYDTPATEELEATLGHDIWATLTITQTIGWLLLGPALTAGALAGEREKGHLDALLLSPLSTSQIVNGKMLGALSLTVLLLLVPLPAIALCFLLGGVSPGEFMASLVLHFSTALFGMSLGMVASAHSRNSGQAIVQALFRRFIAQATMLVFCCVPISPLIALAYLLGASQDAPYWLCFIFLLVHVSLSRIQLRNAAQALSQPLPEARHSPMLETATPLAVLNTLPVTMADSVTQTARRAPLRNAAWLHFENPVLQREAQARLRFKWSSNAGINDVVLGSAVLVFTGYVAPLTLMAWFEPQRCRDLWWLIAYPWLICAIIAAALTSAGTFTREREGGHWPLLWLTPLRHGEIIGGKLGGVLMGIAYWSLCLLPFWIPCFFRLPFSVTVSTFCLIMGAVWLAANIGLCFSALCKKSGTALNWTIISLVVWLLVHPPWQEWQTISLFSALTHTFVLLWLGELLYVATHRILHHAPYER